MRAKYRERLPQLDGGLFLTDGGLETTLVFHEGWDLPCFAAFVLLDSERRKRSAITSTAMCRWRLHRAPASSLKARPGAPTPIGQRSPAMVETRWHDSTAPP